MQRLLPAALLALLLHTTADASPQVLGQTEIAEGRGGFSGPLTDGARFGADITWLSDIDGNGVRELLVGADRANGSEGEAWILFLDPGGNVGSELRIYEGQNGFVGPLNWDDLFGKAVARLGDLNGDGSEDIAISSSGSDKYGLDNGEVWILFLDPDPQFPGQVIGQVSLGKNVNGSPNWSNSSENFGSGLAGLGDLDGDGVEDLAVGADPGFSMSSIGGRVWILFMNTNGTVKSFTEIGEFKNGFNVDLQPADRLGVEIEVLGDLDQDGVVDIAVGAYGDGDGGGFFGAFYVMFLNIDGSVKAFQKVSQTVGGFDGTLEFNGQFGNGIAWLPATQELLVGAYGKSPAGESWLMDLASDGTVSNCRRITGGENGFCGDLQPGDWFGHGASWIGDLDGDGHDDVAIGAMGDDQGGSDRGSVWLTFLTGDEVYSYCACSAALAPCGNAGSDSGCANSTGLGTRMDFVGSASASLDDLVLSTTKAPVGVFGIYFMGGGQGCPTPFGDGLLCVSPGPAAFCRYPIQTSGAGGTFQLGPGIVALSQTFAPICNIDPGETWRFQTWHRDPSGPCGSGFNTSNGVSVTFGP